jgi:hypothetical protein
MKTNPRSVTSNRAKMLKHLDKLDLIQNGTMAPVMLHIAPTNRCNMQCSHCCFSSRNRGMELSKELLTRAIGHASDIGIKAIEYTGGGEPTVYPWINDAIDFASDLGLSQGICTNGWDIAKVNDWSKFAWVRLSLNAMEYEGGSLRLSRSSDWINNQTDVSAAFVVSKKTSFQAVLAAVRFAEDHKIMLRLAPDCIQSHSEISSLISEMNYLLPKSEYAFVSDFNVSTKRPRLCMMHAWKPFLWPDGYLYRCPSSELSTENNRDMLERFRLCHVDEMEKFYSGDMFSYVDTCEYCKYSDQNELLADLIEDTKHNDFT